MGVRRRKGSGSVYQRSDGRWTGSVETSQRHEPRRRRVFYGLTREEVVSKMQAAFPDLVDPDTPASKRSAAMARARELGTHTASEWHTKVAAARNFCHYCGYQCWPSATKDHYVPVARGGSDAIDNIVPCCKRCNSEKGDMTGDEFLDWKRPGWRTL